MSERSVLVRLQAQVGEYVSNMGRAEKATERLADTQDQAGSKATESGRKHEESSRKTEQSSQRTAEQLKREAEAAQDAAKASSLKYDADGRLVDSQGRVLSSSQAAAHGMEGFSDAVYLTAHASQEAEGRLESLARKAKDVEAAGQALVGFGTVTVAGLGAVAKAAMDWESSWAGVTKTVDGTPEQMAEIEAGLRNLARTLPATHQEIAAVAEAAGQLGVKREDIVGFTKTMIDLSETTNLSADEAATMIAQISNVMGTMEREGAAGVARFGSALVALGNDGASTEKDILSMAQRIAGAAATVGATESEVLALSNTLASMGIRAELGGGVTTRVLLKMFAAVKDGGDKMQKWADIAGTTAEEFAKAYSESPVAALDLVTRGLNKMNSEGGNVVSTMRDLGLEGTEETQVMLALAASGDLLSGSLKLSAESIQNTSALMEEANKRYETTESKVRVAWNNIKDAAIEAGAVILPVISDIAEHVAGLAGWFADLPAPVQGVVTALSGVAGITALAAGGFILLFPKVLDTYESFKRLRDIAPDAVAGKLGKAGKIAAGAAAAFALFTTAAAAASQGAAGLNKDTSVAKFTNALQGAAKGSDAAAAAIDKLFNGVNVTGNSMFTAVDDLGGALDRIFNRTRSDHISDFLGTVFGQNATTGINVAKDALSDYDSALAELASGGNAEDAAAGFNIIKEKAKEQGVGIEELVELFPQYGDALLAAASASGTTQVSQEELTAAMQGSGDAAAAAAPLTEEAAEALEEVGLAADGTVESLGKYLESLFAAGLAVMDTREASFEWTNTLRDMGGEIDALMAKQGELGAVLNETGTDFNMSTDAGLEANNMFQGFAREGLNVAQIMSNDVSVSQEQVQGQLKSTYDALLVAGQGFNMTADDAIALAREVLQIPDDVSIDTWLDEEAKRRAEALTGELNKIDGRVVNTYVNINETTTRKEIRLTERNETVHPGQVGITNARGSRLPKHSTGYRLPTTGPGTDRTDGILGISSEGVPLSWVDAGEWIINGRSSEKYDRELKAINDGTFPTGVLDTPAFSTAPAYAGSAVAPGGTGKAEFTGDLYLDSGVFLGVVRGIARSEADQTMRQLDRTIVRIERGGKYAGGR